ncbi:PR domain zinc finger protein 12-like [Gigantopelta aegis]|uniref:PR domain zinc finger protein 12-like n=1 Tax=Gigantopelta aegis TaxID=1735272 RepID=UPI001B88D055|nr:PR domain zinc finger protein 12-like [Gigantopelta aegis]
MEFIEEALKFSLYGHVHSSSFAPFATDIQQDGCFVPTPKQVRLFQSQLPGGSLGVFSTTWIKRGTVMGPFTGRKLNVDQIDHINHNANAWEVFGEDGEVLFYVDGGRDLSQCSWLSYVNCARSEQEQNLETFQVEHNIFYRAIKDIPPKQELLVWYGASFNMYMGLPCSAQHTKDQVLPKGPALKSDSANTDMRVGGKQRCVLCNRGFNSRSNLRSHMRIHTMEKPFRCKFCDKKFSQSSTLRNHTRLHTGEKPYSCLVCRSSYSQLAGLRAHQKSARHRK